MTTFAPPVELLALEKLREQELEEARAIQSMMMPAESLHVGGVTVSHEFQPVAAVGGDFLDYFELPNGSIALYLGDVSGKGLPAALFGALAVGTLRGVHKTYTPAELVLSTLNRRLMMRRMPRRHTAVQYAVFDPHTCEMQISSAGMPGPVHLSANGCCLLELSGVPPGLLPGVDYDAGSLHLAPGDSVLFCTDGITDSMNAQEEMFGTERLLEVCARHNADPPRQLLQAIFSALENFSIGHCQHDDMAAAVFHCAE